MPNKHLPKMPLVEAIFEVRWGNSIVADLAKQMMPTLDPSYGQHYLQFWARMREAYPFYESLRPSGMPEEMFVQQPLHRFRVAPEKWPLVQFGPGIMTVNSTPPDYDFSNQFRSACIGAVDALFQSHPSTETFRPGYMVLRYIDALKSFADAANAFDYMATKLKTNIVLPKGLFDDTQLDSVPEGFGLQYSYRSATPPGVLTLAFNTGTSENKPILLWETRLESGPDQVPQSAASFADWLNNVHNIVVEKLFWRLIEGDLQKEFS